MKKQKKNTVVILTSNRLNNRSHERMNMLTHDNSKFTLLISIGNSCFILFSFHEICKWSTECLLAMHVLRGITHVAKDLSQILLYVSRRVIILNVAYVFEIYHSFSESNRHSIDHLLFYENRAGKISSFLFFF